MNKPAKIFLRVILVTAGLLVLSFVGLVGYVNVMAKIAASEAEVPVAGQVMGNPQGKLTVVEFVDYRCHYCPIMNGTLTESLQYEPDVKVVIRPVGLVDESSAEIARFVMASAKQGKMVELHERLMALSTPAAFDAVREIAAAIGVDVAKAEQDAQSEDIKEQLEGNHDLIANAGFLGVPALIIGGWRFQPNSEDSMTSVNNLRMMFAESFGRLGKKDND